MAVQSFLSLGLRERFPPKSSHQSELPCPLPRDLPDPGIKFASLMEDPLEKEMADHSGILAWKTPWTEEPGRLQSTGSQRVGHAWATSLHSTSGLLHWQAGSWPPAPPGAQCESERRSVEFDSATPWTVAYQASLSTGFSRQAYESGCHFLLQGIVPTQGSNLGSPALQADRCFTLWATAI